MKIFYWSPFISKVATTSSVIRSAESIVKYSKKENNVNLAIIDAVGEWEDYKKLIDPKIEIINLNKKSILDLIDSTCSHYLVTGGDMKFYVSTGEKNKIINL